MAEIPQSIDVWICPECRLRGARTRYVEHQRTCPRHPAGRCDRYRYVPAEATDEMVERVRRWERVHSWEPSGPRGSRRAHHSGGWWRDALTAALSTKEVGGDGC